MAASRTSIQDVHVIELKYSADSSISSAVIPFAMLIIVV